MKHNYFTSYHDYFWLWERNEETVAMIRNGNTIAYKQFLFEIIQKLAPQGLPPFGSLLLAIIATNPKGDSSLNQIREIIAKMLNTTDDTTLEESMRFLNLLVRIPAQYKTQSKRLLLFQAIFENCHNCLSVDESQKIAQACRTGSINLDEPTKPEEMMMGVFRYDFRPLALVVRIFETEDDILQKISGLPDEGQIEINFEERPGEEASVPADLIDDLIENDLTFTTGSLVRWLWGGMNIPVHSSLPSAQPLDGISDLTNKGDFDKLLISEFAYDDFTFLSRLANNEALYIHREIPPTHNNLHRIILIDASLKNWGTPKTIAFAVMLAIARHPKTDIACEGYVLGNEKYHRVSMENVHTIIDALAVVNSKLDTGASLELFLKDHGKDKNTEIFFVTEVTTTKHASLLRVMNEYHDALHYLVLTDIEGNIDLYKKHQRSRKHIQHIQLPLAKLWQKSPLKKIGSTPQEKTATRNLPVLVKPDRVKRIVNTSDNHVYAFTNESAILKRISEQPYVKGWEVVSYEFVFKTNIFEVGVSNHGEHIALLYSHPKREILLMNLTDKTRKSIMFGEWQDTSYPAFIFDNDAFYHLNPSGTWRISLDGQVTKVAPDRLDQKFNDRGAELKKLVDSNILAHNIILKNLNKVFINTKGELIFNLHTLRLYNGEYRIVPAIDRTENISATRLQEGLFRFADGSMLEVIRAGVFLLRSSFPNLPQIYIPSFLDSPLGLATETHFSGNAYFLKDSDCTITLINPGPNKLQTVKILKEVLGLGLKSAKDLADQYPCRIDGTFTVVVANKLRDEMTRNEAQVDIQTSQGSSSQSIISTLMFHDTYIVPFIQTITSHGN